MVFLPRQEVIGNASLPRKTASSEWLGARSAILMYIAKIPLKIQGSVYGSVTYCGTCVERPGSVPRDHRHREGLRIQDNVTEPRLTCDGGDKASRQSLGLGFHLGLCARR